MAIRTIPARTEITCDCCLQVVDDERVTYRLGGDIRIHENVRDGLETVTGFKDRQMDLCDACFARIVIDINNKIRDIRINRA